MVEKVVWKQSPVETPECSCWFCGGEMLRIRNTKIQALKGLNRWQCKNKRCLGVLEFGRRPDAVIKTTVYIGPICPMCKNRMGEEIGGAIRCSVCETMWLRGFQDEIINCMSGEADVVYGYTKGGSSKSGKARKPPNKATKDAYRQSIYGSILTD